MRPAQRITRVLHSGGATAPPASSPLRRLRTPCSLTIATAAAVSALHHPTRGLSQQASRWLDKLRYGTEDAPSLGSWENAYEDNAMDTRKLYCKALVHASGGSRLARDWIAGNAALRSPDPSLIYTALQHTATAADVEALRDHFLQRLIAPDAEQIRRSRCRDDDDNEEGTASFEVAEEEDEVEREVLHEGEVAERAANPATPAETPSNTATTSAGASAAAPAAHDDDGDSDDDGAAVSISPDDVRAAEQLLLARSPEVRCFLYDAMTASLFHSNYDLRTVEVARRHTFWIGANVFGISFDELTLLWRVVEAELLLKKEKTKVLGQPWSE